MSTKENISVEVKNTVVVHKEQSMPGIKETGNSTEPISLKAMRRGRKYA